MQPFADCLSACDLHEMKYQGPYYTWTNKTVWSCIDRAFTNVFWFDLFDFSLVTYTACGLSDHTSMILTMPGIPKPPKSFQFCDMWVTDPLFPLITRPAQHTSNDPCKRLLSYLACTRSALLKLNRDRFGNLRQQQAMARMALESIQLKAMAEPSLSTLQQQES